MKRQTFVLLGTLAILFIASVGVHAEEAEVGVTGSVEFNGSLRELRDEIKTERSDLIKQNKKSRQELREQNKESRDDSKKENKEEREQFKIDAKASLEGKTPEEKAALMVTIKADRKALFDKNRAERQEFRKAQWDSKKSLTVNIKTNMDAFQDSVRSRWEALLASFGKK